MSPVPRRCWRSRSPRASPRPSRSRTNCRRCARASGSPRLGAPRPEQLRLLRRPRRPLHRPVALVRDRRRTAPAPRRAKARAASTTTAASRATWARPTSRQRIFEPRERPWYKAGAANTIQTWTSIYVDFKLQELVATRARRVNDRAGAFKGVVATDLSLRQVTSFLQRLALSSNGVAMVLEKDGNLIGVSRGAHMQTLPDGAAVRLNAAQSTDPLVTATYAAVRGLADAAGDARPHTTVFTDADGDAGAGGLRAPDRRRRPGLAHHGGRAAPGLPARHHRQLPPHRAAGRARGRGGDADRHAGAGHRHARAAPARGRGAPRRPGQHRAARRLARARTSWATSRAASRTCSAACSPTR